MTTLLTPIERISRRIQALFGLYFAENRHHDLERIVKNTASELHFSKQIGDIADWLHQDMIPAHEQEVLIKHLTVTETYFFREKPALELFRQRIIPAIKARGSKEGLHKRVRIWSAGCSSGEEPYTIAMMLRESIPDIDTMNISILATDINSIALNKASEGIYTPWSFRETPVEIKKKYFKQQGKLFEIDASIKRMVRFSRLNLATDPMPVTSDDTPAFNVIFCRNVLMYMNPETIISIAGKFHKALIDGGWLITSQVELNDVYFAPFQRVLFDNGIFYHKASPEEIQTLPTKIALLPSSFSNNSKKHKHLTHHTLPSSRSPSRDATKARVPANKSSNGNALRDGRTEITGKPLIGSLAIEAFFEAALYEECAAACHAYMTEHGLNTKYMLLLAKSYANLGKLEDATVWMRKLLEKESTDAHNYYFYASILIEQGLWDEAGKSLTKALYLQPDHPAAQLSMGQVFKRQGKFQQAQRQLSNLIRDIEKYDDNTLIPSLDGMTAGRLREMARMLAGGLS